MEKLFLGVDTSNYTTSLSLCRENGECVANIKLPLPVKEGEKGLRQSDALFHHTKNLPEAMKMLSPYLKNGEVAACGVSTKPRAVEGSYMPCFLAGVSFAAAFSEGAGVPLYYFSHQCGHLRAAEQSSGFSAEGRFIAFHISGGTTEMLLAEKREGGYNADIIGGSLDISAGQAIDRVGVYMGMSFPAGREIEAAALSYKGKVPRPKTSLKDTYCNLSGLENIAKRDFGENKDKGRTAMLTLSFISRSLISITEAARERYGALPLLYAGGVMSNSIIKRDIEKHFDAYFAPPEFSADNGYGIALLAKDSYQSAMG